MMTEQCEHSTTETLASWARPKLSIQACTWGCNKILVSVRDDNGISHMYTVAELATLRARVATLETAYRIAEAIMRTPPIGVAPRLVDEWREVSQKVEAGR